jgi:hypothetical protein
MQDAPDRAASDELHLACFRSPARKNAMLRFPKIVIGTAAGAALFMLGIMSGHTIGKGESARMLTGTVGQRTLRSYSRFKSLALPGPSQKAPNDVPSLSDRN